jgi:hypothetical protein
MRFSHYNTHVSHSASPRHATAAPSAVSATFGSSHSRALVSHSVLLSCHSRAVVSHSNIQMSMARSSWQAWMIQYSHSAGPRMPGVCLGASCAAASAACAAALASAASAAAFAAFASTRRDWRAGALLPLAAGARAEACAGGLALSACVCSARARHLLRYPSAV